MSEIFQFVCASGRIISTFQCISLISDRYQITAVLSGHNLELIRFRCAGPLEKNCSSA